MEFGEIIVVQLKNGPALGRYLSTPNTPSKSSVTNRIRVAIGKNREAQLTTDRLLMSTGIVDSNVEQTNDLWKLSKDLSGEIDLREAWNIAIDSRNPVSLEDLAELYWGSSDNTAKKIAIILNVYHTNLYFYQDGASYYPRTRKEVEEIQQRRYKLICKQKERELLIDDLRQETLPEKLTQHQQDILNHLRGLAIHGNQYPRSSIAIDLLREIHPNSTEFEKNAFRILVRHGLVSEDEPLELERAGYTSIFPKAVVSASEAIDPSTLISDPKRIDFTKIPTITIDELGTYDRDDAISFHSDAAGFSYLGIHVTDAGFLVPPNSAIDTEAKNRMSSIYLPTQILPMLPHGLVAKSGTLSKGRKQAALSIIAKLSPTNTIIDWDIHRSVIESDDALSYEDAEFALEDTEHRWHRFIHNLDNISTELMSKREVSGSVDIQRPDMAIDIAENDEISIRLSVKNRSRKIIAELMILYNTLMAEFCKSRSIPVIFRSQQAPETISSTDGIEDGPYLWFMKMQRLLPAEFSTIPDAHHSLGVEHYSQVSAPLRRYTDLITQRQIGHYLDTGKFLYPVEEVASVGQRGSIQLREIAGIEDSVKRYWFLKFLAKKMCKGENQKSSVDFYAVALEKSVRRGALLELSEYPFRFRAVVPKTSNPGDVVVVKLQGIDLWHRTTHFTYVSMA